MLVTLTPAVSGTLCYPLFVDEEPRSRSAKSLAQGRSHLIHGGAALSHKAGVTGHVVCLRGTLHPLSLSRQGADGGGQPAQPATS